MRVIKPFLQSLRQLAQARSLAKAFAAPGVMVGLFTLMLCSTSSLAAPKLVPAEDANCTISAMNRNAPVEPDYSYVIHDIPGNSGPFRARAVCSDGTVGQTNVVFPGRNDTVVYLGEIAWGKSDPSPVGLELTATSKRLRAGESAQMRATAIAENASSRDVTRFDQGTRYALSNPLLASLSQDGLLQVLSQFASGSSARVVATAVNEGGVAGSFMFTLGARGSVQGRLTRADGSTPVANAQVSVLRRQTMEQVATVTTDANGNYSVADVNAGSFMISAIEPSTLDRGKTTAEIANEGEVATADFKLNGQGQVTVTVYDGSAQVVPNANVTLTVLGAFSEVRNLQTDAQGKAVFNAVAVGDISVSTRDPATRLVGTVLGRVVLNGNLPLSLKLQPVATIAGKVLASDGSSPQMGIQVRLVSAVRGIITQQVTPEDGSFSFASLALSDGPYTLDAMQDGRLRARVPNLNLNSAGQELRQNIVFAPSGMLKGQLTHANGSPVVGARVTVQSQVGERFAFSTTSDLDGKYLIDGVPVGAFVLTANAGNGEVGSASGSLATDGEQQTINLQLAANGIVGTVFFADGRSPVAENVEVSLQPGNQITRTNQQGQYAFSVSQPGTYKITASDQLGNRGTSSIVITNITPGEPKTLNVVFLGRGTVQGLIRDPGGVPQVGIKVKLTSESVFGGEREVLTNSEGRYRFDGVFVGEMTLFAKNDVSNLAGFARARLAQDGNLVNADVTLAATGSVNGRVLQQNNQTPVANAKVEVLFDRVVVLQTSSDAAGNFNFPAVPMGEFVLRASNLENGDIGQTASRLVTLNEVRVVNVRLLGQAEVRVNLLDQANLPIAGATVTITSHSVFGGEVTGKSDAAGHFVAARILNGDISVSAEKGEGAQKISAFASTTLVNSQPQAINLQLLNRPSGSLSGVVSKGLNAVPQAGVTLQLRGSGVATLQTSTATDGRYHFDAVEIGPDYQLVAIINDKVRANAQSLGLQANQNTERNLSLIGVGVAQGRVVDSANLPQANVRVSLSNADTVYGGTWQTQTGADGNYQINDVPAGAFVLRGQSADGRLQAQANGRVRFDADIAVTDLTLLDSVINLPRTLYDANGTSFDVQINGSWAQGTNNVFLGGGVGSGNTAANQLFVLVNNIPTPFSNSEQQSGRLTQNQQLLETSELHQASGLSVTRRQYVPKNGYFSRNLEILENRTANPITVAVRMVANIAPGIGGARVVDTSSNDSVLDVSNPLSRDRWLVADDDRDTDPFENSANPAVAMVFDGVGAANQVAQAQTTAIGAATQLQWQWNNLTVQPGASIGLLHFTSQQLGRVAARATAERLAQLPPEALEGLSEQERAMIINFAVPADGLSQLTALPTVENTSISGKVLAGDGQTPIANAQVRFKSESLYYGRQYSVTSNAEGQYRFAAGNFGLWNVLALPQQSFTAIARHPKTSAITANGIVEFDLASPNLQKDLLFVGTGNLNGQVQRHNGANASAGSVQMPYRLPNGQDIVLSSDLGGDGSFAFAGIAPGEYTVQASQSHAQGEAVTGMKSAVVSAGNTSLLAISLQPTGEINGRVNAANGEPVVNAIVRLDPRQDGGQYRATRTDTGGNYRLPDVALGNHQVLVQGENGLQATDAAFVTVDAVTVVNLRLAGTGQLKVQVNYQRGAPAVDAAVTVNARTLRTDGAGQVSFSAPADEDLSVQVSHPDNSTLRVQGSSRIVGNGNTATLSLSLPAAANIVGTVLRPDGVTPARSIKLQLRFSDSSGVQREIFSDENGAFRFKGLELRQYVVSALDQANFKFADADAALGEDGQEVSLTMRLADNRIALPASLFDANDFAYDIQTNGSIGYGARGDQWSGIYHLGGAQLLINGSPFTGESSALLEAGRRQMLIKQATPLAGLQVSRKIFVPAGGYFARYLEILENPGTEPISVAVQLNSRLSQRRSASVVATSSGDTELQGSGPGRDTWVIFDDASQADSFLSNTQPAGVMVLGRADSPAAHDQLALAQSNGLNLQAGWSQLTIAPGSKRILMHFEVQQIERAGAQFAAERLQSLPPEVLAAMSEDELTAVANFALPADGQSSVAALPSLLGQVSGVVMEGDRRTRVPRTRVEIKSTHPLFSRTYLPSCMLNTQNLQADVNGAYSISGTMNTQNSVAVPVGSDIVVQAAHDYYHCAGYQYGHVFSYIPSLVANAHFAEGSSVAQQDVVFESGILTGTVNGPNDYSVAGGSVSTQVALNGITLGTPIANDGSYTLTGLPPGTYLLKADVWHPQGTGLLGSRDNSQVNSGQVTVTDINIEDTGSFNGAVVTANGEAAVRVDLMLQKVGGRYVGRSAQTDSLGRFNFSALPVGQYNVTVFDQISGGRSNLQIEISRNQVLSKNIVMNGNGTLRLTVNFARGTPAASVDVYLQSSAGSGQFEVRGRTDNLGQLQLLVPVGDYVVRVFNPMEYYVSGRVWKEVRGSLASNNQAATAEVNLDARVNVALTVTDASNLPLPAANVSLTDKRCPAGCNVGSTNQNGQLQIRGVYDGNFKIEVRSANGRMVQINDVVDSSNDGQTLERTASFAANVEYTGNFSFGTERQVFTISANANDVVDLSFNGVSVNGSASSYMTHAQVYDADKQMLAAGYTFDARNNFQQYNELGDMHRIIATGPLSLVMSPYYQSNSYLGNFRVAALVNGVPTPLLPYQNGGVVQGVLQKAIGDPAPDETVDILGNDALGLHLRQKSDSAGHYQFNALPLANYQLAVLDADGLAIAAASESLTLAGQQIQRDFRLPVKNAVRLQIEIAAPLSVPSYMYANLNDQNGQRRIGPFYFSGGARTSGIVSVIAYGDGANVSAVHPNNSVIQLLKNLDGTDGSLLTLKLAAGGVKGQVTNALAQPVASAYIWVESAQGNLASVVSDAQGNYLMPTLPIEMPLTIVVSEPNTNVLTRANVTVQTGQVETVNLQVVGIGSLHGVLRNSAGRGLPRMPVTLEYSTDATRGQTNRLSTRTDANGAYRFETVPVGQDMSLMATVNTHFQRLQAEAVAHLQTQGEDAQLDLTVTYSGGAALVRVIGSDGLPAGARCQQVELLASDGQSGIWSRFGGDDGDPPNLARAAVKRSLAKGKTLSETPDLPAGPENCRNGILFDAVPAGAASINVTLESGKIIGPIAVQIVEAAQADAVVPVSVVKGIVRFADGTPVANPSAVLSSSDGEVVYNSYIAEDGDGECGECGGGNGGNEGQFRFEAVVLGDYSIAVEDNQSGLRKIQQGTMLDLNQAVEQDISLPLAGIVSGTVRNRQNQPVTYTPVYVGSSASDLERYSYTDANGVFRLEQVALGNINVYAYINGEAVIATASGELTEQAPSLNLDVSPSAQAQLSGRVLLNGNAVANAYLELRSENVFGPYGNFSATTYSDADGNYRFAVTPVGSLRVVARNGNGNEGGAVGVGFITTVADTEANLEIGLGNGLAMPHQFNSGAQSRYSLQCNGVMDAGNLAESNLPYMTGYALSVGGQGFPCENVALVSNDGQQAQLGPVALKQVRVSRHIYVPASGGFLRYMDSLHNPGASAVNLNVEVNSYLDNLQVVLAESQSAGRYVVSHDRNGVAPFLAHVFASAGARLPGVYTSRQENNDLRYQWRVTIPAGATVSLLHFSAISGSGEAATAQAEALANGTAAGMFTGLTSTDQSNIQNFVVTP